MDKEVKARSGRAGRAGSMGRAAHVSHAAHAGLAGRSDCVGCASLEVHSGRADHAAHTDHAARATRLGLMGRAARSFVAASLAISMVGVVGTVPAYADDAAGGGSSSNPADGVRWATLYGMNGTKLVSTGAGDSINQTVMLGSGGTASAAVFDGGKDSVEGAKGAADAALLRYDDQGNLLRDEDGNVVGETLVGGTGNDYFLGLAESNMGGFVAVGVTQSTDGDLAGLAKGGNDGLIAKFDAAGVLQKVVTFGGSDKDQLTRVVNSWDGGFVAAGYTHSSDGDLVGVKTSAARNAVIAKYDADLNLQWVRAIDDAGAYEFDDVLVTIEGGYLATGYATTSENGKDALAVKLTDAGEVEWVKTYGGTGDDVLSASLRAPEKVAGTGRDGEGDAGDFPTDDDVAARDGGYIFAGTTDSVDGTFADAFTYEGDPEEGKADSAFVMKVDAAGNVEYVDMVESSAGATGVGLAEADEGFLLAGTFGAADQDFSGAPYAGKTDLFTALYSSDGYRLNVKTFGSDQQDTLKGIWHGYADDYLLYGNVKNSQGTNFYGNVARGSYDGFLMSVDAEPLMTYAEEKYLVPVEVWKLTSNEASMMSSLLYADAYVEKTGDLYMVTVYFVNAEIMGSQINASTLGNVTYDHNGQVIAAESDTYDPVTQVKTVTLRTDSLTDPLTIYIDKTMAKDGVRLHFVAGDAEPTENPPYFPPVEIGAPEFESLWKANMGGSTTDYSNSAAVLANGNLLVTGQTYSHDGDLQAA